MTIILRAAFLLIAAFSGCSAAPPAPSACERGDSPMLHDVLYFGRNRPDGGMVSDSQWQIFLDAVISPRFPEGLTIVHATGQWKGKTGNLEQEQSEIVTVLHSGDEESRRKVSEIADEYKRRFNQEAVLRERTPICALFQ